MVVPPGPTKPGAAATEVYFTLYCTTAPVSSTFLQHSLSFSAQKKFKIYRFMYNTMIFDKTNEIKMTI